MFQDGTGPLNAARPEAARRDRPSPGRARPIPALEEADATRKPSAGIPASHCPTTVPMLRGGDGPTPMALPRHRPEAVPVGIGPTGPPSRGEAANKPLTRLGNPFEYPLKALKRFYRDRPSRCSARAFEFPADSHPRNAVKNRRFQAFPVPVRPRRFSLDCANLCRGPHFRVYGPIAPTPLRIPCFTRLSASHPA